MTYSGTLPDILTQLWGSVEGVHRRSELSARVADATGVSAQTASTWMRGKQLPQGVTRIRVMVFLADELNAVVSEFDKLEKDVQTLCRLIAQDKVTLEQLTAALDYKTKTQSTHRLLRGETQLIRGLDSKVKAAIATYGPADVKSDEVSSPPDASPPTSIPATPAPAPNRVGCDNALVLRVSGLVLQLLPDLEALVSSDDPRLHAAIRKTVGEERYVQFSNLTNALTGPRPMERFQSEYRRKAAAQ